MASFPAYYGKIKDVTDIVKGRGKKFPVSEETFHLSHDSRKQKLVVLTAAGGKLLPKIFNDGEFANINGVVMAAFYGIFQDKSAEISQHWDRVARKVEIPVNSDFLGTVDGAYSFEDQHLVVVIYRGGPNADVRITPKGKMFCYQSKGSGGGDCCVM